MKLVIIFVIKMYKKLISPILSFFGIHCKFYPTCSEYMLQAINKYGVFKGILLGLKRLFRCHPFSRGGYDPLN